MKEFQSHVEMRWHIPDGLKQELTALVDAPGDGVTLRNPRIDSGVLSEGTTLARRYEEFTVDFAPSRSWFHSGSRVRPMGRILRSTKPSIIAVSLGFPGVRRPYGNNEYQVALEVHLVPLVEHLREYEVLHGCTGVVSPSDDFTRSLVEFTAARLGLRAGEINHTPVWYVRNP